MPKKKKKTTKKVRRIHFFGSIFKALRLSLSNMWRNKFLTVATVVVMGILLFIFNIILAVNFVASSALDDLTKKVDVVIYLTDNIEYYQVQQMTNDLSKLPGVTEVGYTSKSDALKIVSSTHPKTAEFLMRYGMDNPLPASINIKTEKPELHVTVQSFLNQEKYRHMLANVVAGRDSRASVKDVVTENLINLNNATNQIVFWVFLVFIIGGVFIISNAIQLTIYNRQKEIYIMRLVGATHRFIQLPFLFEGMFYGIISVIFASILLILISTQIQIANISFTTYFKELPILTIFAIELIASVILGILCSFIAVYRYLKSKLILE